MEQANTLSSRLVPESQEVRDGMRWIAVTQCFSFAHVQDDGPITQRMIYEHNKSAYHKSKLKLTPKKVCCIACGAVDRSGARISIMTGVCKDMNVCLILIPFMHSL